MRQRGPELLEDRQVVREHCRGRPGLGEAPLEALRKTLAGNRILTPAIMGYEAVYLLLQALLVLAMGVQSLVVLGPSGNI